MANLPGTRIRDNGIFGTITDNPLTAGATSFNSAALAGLSTIAGDHAIITLDPLKQFGNPEIVMVTAHTAAATVATIQRGMFGTTARSHPQGTLWVHAATNDDFIRIRTSATRPADVYRGQRIFETDTNRFVARTITDTWQQDGLFFDPPACRVFHNAVQSISDNTWTSLSMNSERFDTDTMHDTVTNNSRITFNTAGIYVVSGAAVLASGTDYSLIGLRFLKNGGTNIGEVVDVPTTFNTAPALSLSTIYKFIVGDYLEFQIIQDNTANTARNTQALTEFAPEFTACWIGRGN